MKRMGWKRLLAGILCVSMLGSQVSWAASGTGTAVPESWETVSETVGAEGPGAMQAEEVSVGPETIATASDAGVSASPSDAEYETDPETGEILDGMIFDDIVEGKVSGAGALAAKNALEHTSSDAVRVEYPLPGKEATLYLDVSADGEAVIVDARGWLDYEVEIPDTVPYDDGMEAEIVGIALGAFCACPELRSVILPAGIRYIEHDAFYNWGDSAHRLDFWYQGSEEQWAADVVNEADYVNCVHFDYDPSTWVIQFRAEGLGWAEGEPVTVVIDRGETLDADDVPTAADIPNGRFSGWGTDSQWMSYDEVYPEYWIVETQAVTWPIVPQANTVFYALYAEKYYVVTRDMNDGSGHTEKDRFQADEFNEVYYNYSSLNGYENGDMACYGWSLDPNADYHDFAPGTDAEGILLTLDGDVTIYAVWGPSVQVTFDPDGHAGEVETIRYRVGHELVPQGHPDGSGMVFRGYSLTSGGPVDLPIYQTYILNSDMTLFEVWGQEIVLTLDPNGGTGDPVELSNAYGAQMINGPETYGFAREGYSAAGWSLRSDAKPGDDDVFSEKWMDEFTKTETLYTVWAKDCIVTIVDSRSGEEKVYLRSEGKCLDLSNSDLNSVFGVDLQEQGAGIAGLCTERPKDADAFIPEGIAFDPYYGVVASDVTLYTVYRKMTRISIIYGDFEDTVFVDPEEPDYSIGWWGNGSLDAEAFTSSMLGTPLRIGAINTDESSEYFGKMLAGWNVNGRTVYQNHLRITGDTVISPEYQNFHVVSVKDENDDLVEEYVIPEGQFIRLDRLEVNLRPNYSIIGWNKTRNASADDPGFITNGIYTPTEDVTLYPVYGERMYLIGYYLYPDAVPEEDDPDFVLGTEPGKPIPVLSEEYFWDTYYQDMYLDGFRVVGDPDAGIVYGGDYVPAGGVKIQANWQPYFATVRVNYNTEGQQYGGGSARFRARKEGDPVFLDLSYLEEDYLMNYGMKLIGFSDSEGGEILYENGESFIPEGDMTLYAVWEPADSGKYVHIGFELNGGDFEALLDEAVLRKGEPFSALAQFGESSHPLKDGFSFSGWYLDEACTDPADPEMVPEADTVLYAGWHEGVQIRWIMYPYGYRYFSYDWDHPYSTWQETGISPVLPLAAYKEDTLGQLSKIGGDSWYLGAAHKGWMINGEFYEELSDYTVTGETLIEAVWTSEDLVTLTFRADDGFLGNKMAYDRKTAVYSVPRGGRFLTDLRWLFPARQYAPEASKKAIGWVTEEDPWTPVDFSTAVFTKDTVLHPLWELPENILEIELDKTTLTMIAGETGILTAAITPPHPTADRVVWTSSDPSVVTVDDDGKLKALKGGTAVITAASEKDPSVEASCEVTVLVPVKDVKLNTYERTIALGKNFQLKAWPQPSTATNKAVTWTSSNPAVATVSSTGLVKSVAEGTANITVKTADGGFTATCKITVVIPVTDVKINVTTGEKTIAPGKTFQLKAWPQPSTATNRAVTWESSDETVATVDSTGLVTAVKAGTATVTVTTADGGFTAECRIIVKVPVTGVKINAAEKIIAPGKTFKLAAWPQPSTATDKAVTWESSDTSVATVDSTGLVTAVKLGTAVITVKTADGGFTETCRITVKVPVTGVKINVSTGEKTIDVGKTFQLKAWPQPSNATDKTVTWTSSNPSVATVSASGLVKGVKAGTATITVKTADGGKTATCKITVKTATVAVTSVKINTTAKSMKAGATFQLAAWPQPGNATNKKVTWTSSNPAVATVSSTGLVKAVKKGTATITVKTVDSGKTAACKITVQ